MTSERPDQAGSDRRRHDGDNPRHAEISWPVRLALPAWVAASVYLLLGELTTPLEDGLRRLLFGVFVAGLIVIAVVLVRKWRRTRT